MWNKNAAAVAALHTVDVGRWQDAFGEVIDRIAPRLARYEPLRHAAGLMQGMLAGLDRKNCWTIAEHRGQSTPHGLQHLLARAKWSADGVRDDLRCYVADHFGDPEAILVADETGDVKKGLHSVGVQRQYTGTAGRIENAQVGVFLAYATARGHALIDRALYLPHSWTDDRDRCAAAGIPDDVEFATKAEEEAASSANGDDENAARRHPGAEICSDFWRGTLAQIRRDSALQVGRSLVEEE